MPDEGQVQQERWAWLRRQQHRRPDYARYFCSGCTRYLGAARSSCPTCH